MPLPCSHKFCDNCLTTYLTLKITEADVRHLSCPDCETGLDLQLIFKLVGLELYEKYLKFKEVKELEKEVYVKWCPQPDCNGYDVANPENYNLICKECKHQYCYSCSQPWHTGKCKITEDPKFRKWARAEGIRICPKCKTYIQKNGGCLHMKCPKCEYKWCWICGKDYTSSNHTAFRCYLGRNLLDFYWYTIIFFILFPIALAFWLLVFVIYKIEVTDDFIIDESKLRRYKIFLYILCLILSPFGYLAVPLIPVITFALIYKRIRKEIGVQKCSRAKFSPGCIFVHFLVALATLLISGLVLAGMVALIAIGIVLLPPLGLILMTLKICYIIHQCRKPITFDYPRSFA